MHTNLTTLSPIEFRPDDPEGKLAAVRAALRDQSGLKPQDQFLRRCPMLHMARLQIIEDVLHRIGARAPDSLKSSYLLLVAEIDGEVDDFLDALYNGPVSPFDWNQADADSTDHAAFVHSIWGQCTGYPQQTGAVFFRRYMHRCRIKTSLPYGSYEFSVGEIVAAKRKQAQFASFVTRTQGKSPDELFEEWKQFSARYL